MPTPKKTEAEKLRTIPVRLALPQYRQLQAFLKVEGASIQEVLRQIIAAGLDERARGLQARGIAYPKKAFFYNADDAAFSAFLHGGGSEEPELPLQAEPPRRGLRVSTAG